MNFAVYSKDGCPYCDKIKQVMDLTKLSYVVYNLNEDFDRDSFYGEFGQGSTFPQVVVDGCLLYTSPSPRDRTRSRMPSSA